ncbi:uncharacterized protein LOC124161042 [Ischnura elegans]|uniref:uncharacterized protein LOC124161042 n=1 Tax=Ischnura elegans TaxID=197161 RepID=UPI001ED8AEB2|nr:uncharacterized protein LOC124161042 [Ischnura elegans]XP_046393151.1 uncharacterized protein LOC124161042 [Ischnura elegans]XP_046393152.1 uncharacterized protein LOC124161042 [Ischnura elegans]
MNSISSPSPTPSDDPANISDTCASSEESDHEVFSDDTSYTSDDDSRSNEQNEIDIDDFLKQPIYDVDSSMTIGGFLTSLFALYSKHKLSKCCFEDILKLVINTIPQPHNLPTSKYKLFKCLEKLSSNFVPQTHEYCLSCTGYIDPAEMNECNNCPTCGSSEKSFFVSIPIKSCINNLIQNCGIYKHLVDQEDTIDISDILTSAKYNELKSELNLGKDDFVLTVNTDGVPLAKSSATQLWPLQATINNLPPHLRQYFIIVCGVWVGQTKPNMNTFLRPLCEELANNPTLTWSHPVTKKKVKSTIAISCISVDSPARASIQNICQFNGKFGCNFCEQEGESIEKGRGHARVYPLSEDDPVPVRTKENMLRQAEERNEKNRCGVKGHSIMSIIPYFDISSSFIPDYMHCVLLGVVRQFLSLWFDTSNCNESWYIGPNMRREINENLESIKPPDIIVRLPRSIEKKSMWKASELRSWLLYYSTPLLHGKVGDQYFQHWLLLVKAIFMLLKEKITEDELRLAEILLRCFVRITERLYKLQECTYNLHLLTHLASSVRSWGPLWATSCFPFESNNGYLLKLLHGTHNQRAELVNSLKMVNLNQVLECKTRVRHETSQHVVEEEFKEVGAEVNLEVPVDVINQVLRVDDICDQNTAVQVYNRVKLAGEEIFSSKGYQRETKRNSCTVCFKTEDSIEKYGEVQYYLKINNGQRKTMYAVVNTFTANKECFVHSGTGVAIDHIASVLEYQRNVLVKVKNISCKVINLWSKFICIRPNFLERNM